MENSDITIALLGSITSVITAIVAGYYAIRVAHIEQKRISSKSGDGQKENAQNASARKSNIVILIILLTIVVFAVNLLGNWISGTPSEILFADTLDGVILFVIFFITNYKIANNLFVEKTEIRRVLMPSIVIGALIMPFAFLLGLAINQFFTPELIGINLDIDIEKQIIHYNIIFGGAIDGMIGGAIGVVSGFILGATKKRIVVSVE